MRSFPENASMYDAVLLNISDSTVRTAISFYGRKYSFEKVLSVIDTLADNLAAEYSLKKGDTVTLCMPNSPAALYCFYAANKLGVAVNLVHPFIPPEKLRESVRRTGSKLVLVYDLYKCGRADFGVPALVSDSSSYMGAAARIYYKLTNRRTAFGPSFEKLLRARGNPRLPAANWRAGEPAVYLASGGTTGEPKIIAHDNLVFNRLCAKAEEFLSEPLEAYSALYNVLPIFHGFGLCINMHMCAMMRRTNIMCIKFDAKRSAKQIIAYLTAYYADEGACDKSSVEYRYARQTLDLADTFDRSRPKAATLHEFVEELSELVLRNDFDVASDGDSVALSGGSFRRWRWSKNRG